MKRRVIRCFNGVMMAAGMLSIVACSDDEKTAQKAEVIMEITDAPSDDASIKSVMVTVAEVKVNGQKLEGFSRQTIDLKAYQEGNTKLLGTTSLDARSYSNLELVLDAQSDASNSGKPGCYVLTYDNTVFNLASGSEKVNVIVNNAWKVSAESANRMVIDFDLRKSIRHSDTSGEQYSFVSSSNLNSAVRIVSKDGSGFIKGSYSNESETEADKIIVFAYKRGTFNAEAESSAQSSDGIYFRNAVASAEVKQSITGNAYTLAYLPEGDYELHFVAFNKNASTGRLQMSALLRSETSVDGSIADFVKVRAGLTTTISAAVTGVAN
jgi:hypothetical protein